MFTALLTANAPTDPSTLQIVWFLLIAILWTAFFVTEGFDFGVGMLLPVLGRKDAAHTASEAEKRRRVLLTTIGPFWDGNEVWLLTAGGATFAAFPEWYATLFSGFYLPLLLVLVALIVRAMGFEYRHKRDSDAWRRGWDAAIISGSLVAPLILGVGLTNVVRGVPIDSDLEYVGGFFNLLNPFALLGGLTIVGLCLTHGAHFIALKTEGDIRTEARALATKLGLGTAVLAVLLLGWLNISLGFERVWVIVSTVIAAVALLAAIAMNQRDREGLAFVGTTVTIAAAVATYFLALFPNVMPTTLEGGTSLTVVNASSSPMTLTIMTWAAVVFTPIVLVYTAWGYWVFRKRIGTQHIPDAVPVH